MAATAAIGRAGVLVVVPAVRRPAQPRLELGDRRVQCRVEAVGAGLRADGGPAAGQGDLHPLAGLGLPPVGLVGKFHIHPNDLRVITFAAVQLLRDVHAKMLRNLHISALDDDVHKSSCLAGN